jgi:hypothetical protein
MTHKSLFDQRLPMLAFALFSIFIVSPASALSMKECSIKYKAAQGAGEAEGISWSEFRKTKCTDPVASGDASASSGPEDSKKAKAVDGKSQTEARQAEPEVKTGSTQTTFPTSIAAKFANEKPSRARMHTCVAQYHVNKAAKTLGGMRWIEKGGGYYKLCNARLKGNG